MKKKLICYLYTTDKIQERRFFESDELDVESILLTDILAFDTEHKEEFETLLVDEEENYQ